MNLPKRIYYTACAAWPVSVLKKMAPATVLFPYQHLVSDYEAPHVKHLYPYKNTAQFENDLDFLLRHYRPVSISDMMDAVNAGKKLPPHSFLLSFDDGFREIYEVVAPILTAKGIPAVFFINPAFLDNAQLFYRCKVSLLIDAILKKSDDRLLVGRCATVMGKSGLSLDQLLAAIKKINYLNREKTEELAFITEISFNDYLRDHKPFMTSGQVKELSDRGFTIGAHSWDHPYYDLIPLGEQLLQTKRSALFVSEKFSPRQLFFSFPHRDRVVNQDFFEQIKKDQPGIDLFFGTQNQKNELNNRTVHRFNSEDPDLSMKGQLKGLLLLMAIRRLFNTEKAARPGSKTGV